jgi:hypothetical protein
MVTQRDPMGTRGFLVWALITASFALAWVALELGGSGWFLDYRLPSSDFWGRVVALMVIGAVAIGALVTAAVGLLLSALRRPRGGARW